MAKAKAVDLGDDVTILRPAQMIGLVRSMIRARLPIMLTGAPGVGKSDIVAQACEAEGMDVIISHPVVSDPTDAKGLPWPDHDKGEATFLPFGELAQAVKAERPTVWFIDDLGQAAPAVQASFMQLILARRVNHHLLPKHVTFVAATNRRTDRAGVSGILEPVKSRFATIVELRPTLDDFKEWWFDKSGLDCPEVPAFLTFKSDMLHNFEPTADLKNSACPRTWAHVGKLLAARLPANVEFPAIAGAVGQGAASEFVGFLKLFRELPDPEDILADPKRAKIPTDPSAKYAIVGSLANRATEKNFDRILTYAERMRSEAGEAEFGVLLIRDSYRRNKKIKETQAFIKLTTSEFGKLIMGRD